MWNDDAVAASLESAAFWVKGLPYVKSLSGYWKFFLASAPANVPGGFYDSAFDDSAWKTLPGKFICLQFLTVHLCALCFVLVVRMVYLLWQMFLVFGLPPNFNL